MMIQYKTPINILKFSQLLEIQVLVESKYGLFPKEYERGMLHLLDSSVD